MGDFFMRVGLVVIVGLLSSSGCATHQSLRRHTVKANNTLADLNFQQILNNVAAFEANPYGIPSLAVVNGGTVTVADQKNHGGGAVYSPTMVFNQQGGGFPILQLLPSFNWQREITANWSTFPISDADNLRRLRCAFQLLVLGEEAADSDCKDQVLDFFLGEEDSIHRLIPRGWYGVGHRKKDVPKCACYVGCYKGCPCDVYVWVTPEGLEGLGRFTLTVLDLATGHLHAPEKTVVRTYKADGTLEQTQVTTREIDYDALERERKERGLQFLWERNRDVNAPPINQGMFFVPR